MAYRYELRPAAAHDVLKLTRRNYDLLHAIFTEHLPLILKNPLEAGRPKKGDLAGLRGYDLNFRSVAYRLVYQVNRDLVLIIAFGAHDEAYRRASRR